MRSADQHSIDLLKSFLNINSDLTQRVRVKLDLTEEQLLGEFLDAATGLNKAPHELIPLINTEAFKSRIPSMMHNTRMLGVLQDILNPINLNVVPENAINKDWNSVNQRTDAERIAYLEAEVTALKGANEKLTQKVIAQQKEIIRLRSPNYIPGSENIPKSVNVNKI
jgi:hypothetical protein